jgi:hypothetical protein
MLYASDGSWNVTVVDGLTLTGLHAADGSFNVVDASGETDPVGINHPCGAMWVTLATPDTNTPRHSDVGSLFVSTTGNPSTAQRVTLVSGVLA